MYIDENGVEYKNNQVYEVLDVRQSGSRDEFYGYTLFLFTVVQNISNNERFCFEILARNSSEVAQIREYQIIVKGDNIVFKDDNDPEGGFIFVSFKN